MASIASPNSAELTDLRLAPPAAAVKELSIVRVVNKPPRRRNHSCGKRFVGCALLLSIGTAMALTLIGSRPSEEALPQIDVLFLLHDAGESLSVQRTVASLAGSYRFAALCLGEPAITIFADALNVTTLAPIDVGITQRIADGTERNATLGASDVSRVLARLGQAGPKLVVAGMAYAMQAQLARAFRYVGSYAVGIDDGIGVEWDPRSPLNRAFFTSEPSAAIDELWVGDAPFAANVSEWLATRPSPSGRPSLSVILTGSGTLGAWRAAADDATQVAATRRRMLCCHGGTWPEGTVMVVYAGGYGGAQYTHALRLFCECVSRLPNIGFVFSPHPGYASSYEAALFRLWGCLGPANLKVVDGAWGGVTTAQLVAASNASLSLGSTVGAQSLAIGVPHVYVTDCYRNLWTRLGLIPTAPTASDLARIVNVTLREEGYAVAADAMAVAGVPLNGTANQIARLRALLQS